MLRNRLPALLASLLLLALPAPAGTEATPTDLSAQPTATPRPARGYILLTCTQGAYWLPLPEEEDYTVPVRQIRPDGTEEVNLVHVTPEGFYMEESTCENHDCVEQGIVTLDNRHTRVLANMVICLPNQVTLELYTPEEILEMYAPQGQETGEGE